MDKINAWTWVGIIACSLGLWYVIISGFVGAIGLLNG